MILHNINNESLEKLDACKDEKIDIFITGNGGTLQILTNMVYIINKNPQKYTVITSGENHSGSLLFLLLVKCPVIVFKTAVGGYHSSYQTREVNSSNRPRDNFEVFMHNNFKKSSYDRKRMHKDLELSKAEIKIVERGDFVYFNSERLKYLITKDFSWILE